MTEELPVEMRDPLKTMERGRALLAIWEGKNPQLYTKRYYPCGCMAEGPGDVPAYCPEHDKPPTGVKS